MGAHNSKCQRPGTFFGAVGAGAGSFPVVFGWSLLRSVDPLGAAGSAGSWPLSWKNSSRISQITKIYLDNQILCETQC